MTLEETFSISRSYGFQGIHTEAALVSEITEPSLAFELGYLNIGDTILTVDDSAVTSEEDLRIVESDTSVALMNVKVKLKSGQDASAATIMRYGEKYLNIRDAILSMKATLRKDHIDIAISTMQLGQCCLENGDFDAAKPLLEEALNNAYGYKQGVNEYVCQCYLYQAQIAYGENRGVDARRHLREAIDMYKKIGESMDVQQLRAYAKLIVLAGEDDDSSFKDTIAKQAMEIQQKIVVTQVGEEYMR